MKKRSVIISLIVLIIISLGVILINYDNNKHTVLTNDTIDVESISNLSMMLETDADSGVYEVSDNSEWPTSGYTFNSTLSKCENGSTISWDSDNNQVIVSSTVSDKCYIYFDVKVIFSEYIISLYTKDGQNGLYYFDGEGDYTNASYEASDYSYRYSGASDEVNNYVCLSTDDVCSAEDLYRIIGVFLNEDNEYEVKLIKNSICTSEMCGEEGDYYSNNSYHWNSANYGSVLFDYTGDTALFSTNLNVNSINYLDANANLIATHNWIYLSYVDDTIISSDSLTSYNLESTYYNGDYYDKIGLLFITEYYYSSDPTYWSYPGYSSSGAEYDYRAATDNNWIYLGSDEWTILSYQYAAYYIDYTGYVNIKSIRNNTLAGITDGYAYIRPTFYLSTDVQYKSGTGTYNNPYYISL